MTRVFVEPIGLTLTSPRRRPCSTPSCAPVEIRTDCAGRGTCGKCLVRLGAGELTAHTERELKRIPEKLRDEGWRLACQAYPRRRASASRCAAPPGSAASSPPRSCTTAKPHPAVAHEAVELEPPTLEDARSDLERFDEALGGVEVPLNVLDCLPKTLRDGQVEGRRHAVRQARRRRAPGRRERRRCYGVAVDIGTSKVIAYLFDLERGALIDQEAIENPQMRYGEDVISRIDQAAHLRRGRRARPRGARAASTTNLKALYERQGIEPDHVYDMTVVGNTAMHHLALGLSPVGLGPGAVRAGRRRAAHATRQ